MVKYKYNKYLKTNGATPRDIRIKFYFKKLLKKYAYEK